MNVTLLYGVPGTVVLWYYRTVRTAVVHQYDSVALTGTRERRPRTAPQLRQLLFASPQNSNRLDWSTGTHILPLLLLVVIYPVVVCTCILSF